MRAICRSTTKPGPIRSLSVHHQTFEGWGTSLCWWANHVGGWSAAGRDAFVDAVVDPVDGLGYNVFRYNIGGGENPATTTWGPQQTFTALKRFYMHAAFSRYIRPGATFVDVDNPNMVAAVSADGRTLALVVRNADTTTSKALTFDLTALATVGATAEAHRTSRTENLVWLPAVSIQDWRFVATVPAYSITTFVVPMP